MVSPVTGPFVKTWTSYGPPTEGGYAPPWLSGYQSWYKQRKPYNLPLTYTMFRQIVLSWSSDPSYYTSVADCDDPYSFSYYSDLAKNLAINRLNADLGDPSLWSVNLAEYRQALSLVTGPAAKLLEFTRKVRRFDFVGAARVLGTSVPRGVRPVGKAFANNWLAYHLGWEPLIKDIGSSIDLFQSPLPDKVIEGSGTRNDYTTARTTGFIVTLTRREIRSIHRIKCLVKVDNPNLFLANQLGFVNPLTVAWELVPFSFVVDWFTNVGQTLSQMTQFAGCNVSHVSSTAYQVINKTWSRTYPLYSAAAGNYRSVWMTRGNSLPSVTLTIPPFPGLSVARGATAIALLVQSLK